MRNMMMPTRDPDKPIGVPGYPNTYEPDITPKAPDPPDPGADHWSRIGPGRVDPAGGLVPPKAPQLQGPPNYPGLDGGVPRYLNPPFDDRMLNVGGAGPVGQLRPLKKGMIVNWVTSAEPIKQQINFLFNPSVLSTEFGMNPDDPATALDPSKQDANGPQPLLASEGSVTVELLFDRTYEVWDRLTYGDVDAQTAVAKFGVHIDVLAFYSFCHMIDLNDWQGVKGMSWEDLYPKRQLSYKAAFLYVGPNLKFFGYISGLSVQYSHWAQDMTPLRAKITVTFTTQSFIKAGMNMAEAEAPAETDGGRWNGTGKDLTPDKKWWDIWPLIPSGLL